MKFFEIALICIIATLPYSCGNRNTGTENSEADTTSVPDTGFTGIKQFMSGQYIVSEVTFKNGVREGLSKTFYQSGRVRVTFWYENGLRQDSSCWYYEEGQLFRTTPYINDTVHGIQKQFYRTGQLKAELGYKHGYRTLHFRELTREGKLVKDYPDITVSIKDTYKQNGTLTLVLGLTDPKTNVRFFRGHLVNDAYDTTMVKKIRMDGNTGYIDLKKSGSQKTSEVGVIAEVLTGFANRLLLYKKIELPYSDLE